MTQESHGIEFKRLWKDDWLKWISAFASGGVDGGVNDLRVFIQSKPDLSAKAISNTLGAPHRTVERWIKTLREQGAIEFRGAPRTGGYFAKK